MPKLLEICVVWEWLLTSDHFPENDTEAIYITFLVEFFLVIAGVSNLTFDRRKSALAGRAASCHIALMSQVAELLEEASKLLDQFDVAEAS